MAGNGPNSNELSSFEALRRSPFATRMTSSVDQLRNRLVGARTADPPTPNRQNSRHESQAIVSTSALLEPQLVPPARNSNVILDESDTSFKGTPERSEGNQSRTSRDPDGVHSVTLELSKYAGHIIEEMDEIKREVFTETTNPVLRNNEINTSNLTEPSGTISPRRNQQRYSPVDTVRKETNAINSSNLQEIVLPEFDPITVSVNGSMCTFVPIIEGFDHPYRRGWIGPDRSRARSSSPYYAVRVGYDPGIYSSYAAAWVRTADFQANTQKTPEIQGFERYEDAVAYLGWNPITGEAPSGPQYRPPPRTSLGLFPEEGPDPHDWCDSRAGPHEINVEDKSGNKSVSTVSVSVEEGLAEERHYLSTIAKLSAKDFPSLSENPSPRTLSKWIMMMEATLLNPCWSVNGEPLLTHDDSGTMPLPLKTRASELSRILVQLLGEDHNDVLVRYSQYNKSGRGITLFRMICEHFHPNNDNSALTEYAAFIGRVQQNGESVFALSRELQHSFGRLKAMGFPLEDKLLGVQLAHAVLNGAYGNTPGLASFKTDIIRGRLSIASLDFAAFAREVNAVMDSTGLLENGIARKLPAPQVARRVHGGSDSSDATEPEDRNARLGHANLKDEDVDALFLWTKCPVCRIPRGRNDHHLSDCPRLKRRGLKMEYDYNLDESRKQRESTSAGRSRHVHGLVDIHNFKETDSDYFAVSDIVASHIDLGRHDCVGVCNRVESKSTVIARARTLVPDSGATSDMLREFEHFGTDYKRCKNVSVYMGDGSPVPVQGIGTATIKIKGKVIVLPNALHVPTLDCNLMSITRHGLRGRGCSYLASDGEVHLTFPTFALSMPIPDNGDPRFVLETVTDRDRESPNYSPLDHITPLDRPNGRTALLRHIHRGRAITRRQVKEALENKKRIVKAISGTSIEEALTSFTLTPSKTEYLTETELRLDTEAPITETPNQHTIESSRGKQKDRYTRYELETFFGGRQLKDYGILEGLGTGLRVMDNDNQVPTIGRLVNRKRGRRRKESRKTLHPRSVIGMDIGYGPATSPGGYKYVLVLVDKCTTHCWIYGMGGTSGSDIQEALWKFFVDIGGFPKTIQCDFDPRFLGGKVQSLLRTHGCRIRAAPPYHQSQNGLVERRWAILQGMARAFLTEARLPTKFWYWAIREAALRLNMLPVTSHAANPNDVDYLTTPHEAFYGTKPDYRVLFPFGSIGSFRRIRDGTSDRSKFASQGLLGIALGRSEFTNGMIFYNPKLDSLSTSADYYLDRTRSIGDVFPGLQYDGGLTTSCWSVTRADTPLKFEIGEAVYVLNDTKDVMGGIIETPPTTQSDWYTIRLESGEAINALPQDIFTEYNIPTVGSSSDTLGFFTPTWLKRDTKITYLYNDTHYHGYLTITKEGFWEFITRNNDNSVAVRVPLPDLPYSWKYRMQEGVLQLGWQENTGTHISGIARHVSAATLASSMAPANLVKGLHRDNPDSKIWHAAYNEEYDSLADLETFVEIDETEYQALLDKYGEAAMAIPTMNIFTIKKDAQGKPVRAKSRIVVLGNLEKRVWEKVDRYAPVINSAANRLLVAMAVEVGRILKQGDCKNAFCQPWLPDSEITIVRPPKGCPRSKPGTYWRLKKTLYGLSRSPRHWYETFSGILKTLGFNSMAQDPCVFKCTPFKDQPPIYLGMYVDDFVYFSESDDVEKWFETELGARLKVDFMGPVSWFLGCSYDWHTLPDGRVTCHISQHAFVDQLLEKFGMEDCIGSNRLFRQGLPIDCIDRTVSEECKSEEFVRKYQSLMGGLTWLVISTRPDINVATKLLSQFNSKPTRGHMEAAKQVLRYLKNTISHGIWFTQGESRLEGNIGIPDELDTNQLSVFTDACWGPQYAKKPKADRIETAYVDEMKSLQGHYITRMGGAITWGVNRETRTSGSSCEAEIKAMDDGTKSIQFLRHLCTQLGLQDKDSPVPLYNDNKGSVDWGRNGGVVTRKLRHANIRESRVAEAQEHGEIDIVWIPGKDNPADLFTKEHKDISQFNKLRDLMVRPREWIHNELAAPKDATDKPYSTAEVIAARKVDMKAVERNPATSTKRVQFLLGQADVGVDLMEFVADTDEPVTLDSLRELNDPTFMWKDDVDNVPNCT